MQILPGSKQKYLTMNPMTQMTVSLTLTNSKLWLVRVNKFQVWNKKNEQLENFSYKSELYLKWKKLKIYLSFKLRPLSIRLSIHIWGGKPLIWAIFEQINAKWCPKILALRSFEVWKQYMGPSAPGGSAGPG